MLSLQLLLTTTIPAAGGAQYIPLVVGLVLGSWLAKAIVNR